MQLSEKGAAFIRKHEGFIGKFYYDPVHVGTIGIGFTSMSSSFMKWWKENKKTSFGPGSTMTRAEAEQALRYVVDREYGEYVNDFLGRKVPQHVFDAMCSVVYNMGPQALSFEWARLVKAGDYDIAGNKLQNTGTTAKNRKTGQRVKLKGLVTRRKEEARLLVFGNYGGVNVLPTPASAMEDGMLQRGERGPEVKKLIEDLHTLKFYDGVMDDLFGPATEKAVIAFQNKYNLAPDGVAGEKTLAAIKAAMDGPKPDVPNEDFPEHKEEKQGWLAALIDVLLMIFRGGR